MSAQEELMTKEAPFADEESPQEKNTAPVNATNHPIVPNGAEIVQGDYMQHDQAPKRSHPCCGCCCDTRMAVIVVNIINMSFTALGILSFAVISSDGYKAQYDDDEIRAALDELDGARLGTAIGLLVLGGICYAVGVYGAWKFNKIGVIVAGLWYTAEIVRSFVFLNLVGVIMSSFFLYPHVILHNEINKGIMTRENYPHEKQCCTCCN